MRVLIFIIIFLITGFANSQEDRNMGLVAKTSFSLYGPLLYSANNGSTYNSVKGDLGVVFQRKKTDLYLYLSYDYNWISLYSGHYLGISFEQYVLNKKNRIRPYYGVTFMSEISSNHKKGIISDSSFFVGDNYSKGNGSYPYYYNASGFYYGTPFFGGLSIGFDFRLIRGLHLSLDFGLGIKVMRYKYLEWYEYEDYREILEEMPIQSRNLLYANAQLGLRYDFSFGKKSKPQ